MGLDSAVQDFFHNRHTDGDQSSTEQIKTIITYITDIEGDKAYLDRYVEASKVLAFRDATTTTTTTTSISSPYPNYIDFTDSRAMLVFGGDAWDKGGHDLYTLRQLLDLKRRYPDRVVFILGNRDVNKLRILQELGLSSSSLSSQTSNQNDRSVVSTPPFDGILWFKGSGRVGDPDSNPPPTNAVERLQWMLANTMGSPDAFEHRRHELQWEKQQQAKQQLGDDSSIEVSGEEVVESYRISCHPKGELGQFLSQAQLICRLGPLLFLHGSLPLNNEHVTQMYDEKGEASVWNDMTYYMPWLPHGETAHDYGVETIDHWISALNEFCETKVQEWKSEIERIEALGGVDDSQDPIWARRAGYHYGPAYSALIQYGMGMLPNHEKNPSVVYNTFTPSGMPDRFYPDSEEPLMARATKEFFDRTGVQVVLAGHKPQGDMPSPIRVDDEAWVVLGDTSYSSQTVWHHDEKDDDRSDQAHNKDLDRRTNLGRGNSRSFRGEVAVSEILIELDGQEVERVFYHGVLSDGTEYETVNLMTHGKNTTIGQVAPDHLVPSELDSPHQGRWWTKSIFRDGSQLFHAGEGFSIWNFGGKPTQSN